MRRPVGEVRRAWYHCEIHLLFDSCRRSMKVLLLLFLAVARASYPCRGGLMGGGGGGQGLCRTPRPTAGTRTRADMTALDDSRSEGLPQGAGGGGRGQGSHPQRAREWGGLRGSSAAGGPSERGVGACPTFLPLLQLGQWTSVCNSRARSRMRERDVCCGANSRAGGGGGPMPATRGPATPKGPTCPVGPGFASPDPCAAAPGGIVPLLLPAARA